MVKPLSAVIFILTVLSSIIISVVSQLEEKQNQTSGHLIAAQDRDQGIIEEEEKVKQLVNEWLNDKTKDKLNKIITTYYKEQPRILINMNISSYKGLDEFIRHNQMNKSYEGKLKNDKNEHRLIILQNSSTIFITRAVNRFYHWVEVQNVLAVIIFCMIVAGNSSILYRLRSCRRRRSNVNYFIVQLAIADLFVGIFSVTLDSILRYSVAFPYGNFACKSTKFIGDFFIYYSTYLLVALSIDRWEAVVKPLAFTRNGSRGYYLVGGSWILATISTLPATFYSRIKEVEGVQQCYIDLSDFAWKLYMIYVTTVVWILPAIIIAICYTHIVYTIWSKGRSVFVNQIKETRINQRKVAPDEQLKVLSELAIANATGLDNRMSDGREEIASRDDDTSQDTEDDCASSAEEEEKVRQVVAIDGIERLELYTVCRVNGTQSSLHEEGGANNDSDHHGNNQEVEVGRATNEKQVELAGRKLEVGQNCHGQQHGSGVIPKARIKTIKMTLVIVAAYILCWSPFCIINLCVSFRLMANDTNTSVALVTLTQSLTHLNSAVNPIIYWLFSSKRTSSKTCSAPSDTSTKYLTNEKTSSWWNVKRFLNCRYLCCSNQGTIKTDSRMFDKTDTSMPSLRKRSQSTRYDDSKRKSLEQ